MLAEAPISAANVCWNSGRVIELEKDIDGLLCIAYGTGNDQQSAKQQTEWGEETTWTLATTEPIVGPTSDADE